MSIDDYENACFLWANSDGVVLNNLDDTLEGISTFLTRNPSTCFIAESDDEIVGVILCGHDGRRGHIYHLAVKHDYRQRGIGKLLVERVLDALRKVGIKKVNLMVFHTNDLGNKFWESMGFEKKIDAICRSKEITLSRNNDVS